MLYIDPRGVREGIALIFFWKSVFEKHPNIGACYIIMPPSWYRLYAIQIEMGRLSRLVDPETGQHQVCCGLCHCSRWNPTSKLARPLLASCVTDLTGRLVCLSQVNPKVKTWKVLNVGHFGRGSLAFEARSGNLTKRTHVPRRTNSTIVNSKFAGLTRGFVAP